ncbi:hypothetical protein BDW02DRAFT_615948 [Decorospora gaudefroyi]|uniref:protein-ribulosamine 3-kinase n=1 Tax=Decorospora gaudefroyi TaxID=184978 RepID=A0A6A5KKR7_9PLEO|nr:hypothetical protein BDW02DRAFT_615948 [Decorospora gaudefroyi]
MADPLDCETGRQGGFSLNRAVSKEATRVVMPPGAKVLAAEPFTVVLPDQSQKRYFLKCATGQGAKPLVEEEYHSACAINEIVPGLVPQAAGWGEYREGDTKVFFFLGDYHDMDLSAAPEPSWAKSFAHQLEDVIKYDNEINGPWPEYDAACKQLIDGVIPRLLGALQSDGRSIEPALIHGDLWEQNVGIDMETGETILFDPGSTYAHNEMEFGTWRASWAYHFNSPVYMRLYQRQIEPSEPVDEWDDRNRLYSLHPYLNDSAGHPGSISRQTAYNDMLYLCEKYAPLESLEKYSPENDISVTGAYVQHSTHTMREAHLSQSSAS